MNTFDLLKKQFNSCRFVNEVGFYSTFYDGNCGPDLSYFYNASTHFLHISGTGLMDNFKEGKAPWACFAPHIRNITFSEGIQSIGIYAFYQCFYIANITLPKLLTKIGSYSFAYCTNFAQVFGSITISELGDHAFYYCTSLYGFDIIFDIQIIKPYTFAYTRATVEITSSVKTIEEYAFYKQSNLVLSCSQSFRIQTIKHRAFSLTFFY